MVIWVGLDAKATPAKVSLEGARIGLENRVVGGQVHKVSVALARKDGLCDASVLERLSVPRSGSVARGEPFARPVGRLTLDGVSLALLADEEA